MTKDVKIHKRRASTTTPETQSENTQPTQEALAGTSATKKDTEIEPHMQTSSASGDQPNGSELPPAEGPVVRLNVFLQRHGIASRRKADAMILAGQVRINRKVVTTLGSRVHAGDRVSINGRVLKSETPILTYLFNKPDLCLTTRKDSRQRNTIFDIPALKRLPLNVQPVGRLDFRSEGLLILTNDGDLAYALSHPRFHVEKTYAVLVSELFTPDDLERLRNGVELADGFAKPLSVKLGGTEALGGSRGQWLQVVILEGRNRLVRRMLAAIGFKVVRLIRIGIGQVQLPDQLPAGHFAPAEGLIAGILEKYKSRIGADSEGHVHAAPQRRSRSSLREETSIRGDKKSSDTKRKGTRAEKTSRPGRTQTGRRPKSDRKEATKPQDTYARKKEIESMELAKQARLRKKRNEQKSPVSR